MCDGKNGAFKGEKEKLDMVRRRRVSFYVSIPRRRRRKKVSFLAKW
jgi:hypothetical protein